MRARHPRAAAFRVAAFALFAMAAHGQWAGAQPRAAQLSPDSLARALSALRDSPDSAWIPAASRFTFGDSTLAVHHRAPGPVAIAGGTLHVYGTVDGDAVSYAGDIVVHAGGAIHGNAYAILGKVVLDGGTVDGDTRSLSGDLRRTAVPAGGVVRSRSALMLHAVALSAGWLAVLVVVGIGVLVFASPNLDAVSDALERGFWRSLLAGIATELALAPALALLCVGLVLTILGALLIPFAVVAYVLAAAGLVTLGLLAIARLAGRTVLGKEASVAAPPRATALRNLVYGLLMLMVPWFAAGALAWSPRFELVARIIAIAVTWVAATAGLGASVVSRGGVRRAPAARRAMNASSWATPTPISGVTAARRPTPMTTTAPK
jgi:hypothetical protein